MLLACGPVIGAVALRLALWRCVWRCGPVIGTVALCLVLRSCDWRCGAVFGAVALCLVLCGIQIRVLIRASTRSADLFGWEFRFGF